MSASFLYDTCSLLHNSNNNQGVITLALTTDTKSRHQQLFKGWNKFLVNIARDFNQIEAVCRSRNIMNIMDLSDAHVVCHSDIRKQFFLFFFLLGNYWMYLELGGPQKTEVTNGKKSNCICSISLHKCNSVYICTWHLPLTHRSTSYGPQGVPSITLSAIRTGTSRPTGLQNNMHGLSAHKHTQNPVVRCMM